MPIGRDDIIPALMFGVVMFVIVMLVDLYACGAFDGHTVHAETCEDDEPKS